MKKRLSANKKVLMVLYQFPPSGDVGAFRPVRFIKHLGRFNYQPVVIAPSDGIHGSYDNGLENQIQGKCKIYRLRTFYPFNFLKALPFPNSRSIHDTIWRIWKRMAIPDYAVSWIPFGIIDGLKIAKNEKVDIIYSSGPPFSVFLIAAVINRLTKKKLVLDYRDPWTLSPFYRGTRFRRWLETKLEKFCLRSMDKAIFTTDDMRILHEDEIMITRDRLKSCTIHNSYELKKINAPEAKLREKSKDQYLILHAGDFYGTRTPELFLKGLAIGVNDNATLRKNIKVVFIGSFDKKKYTKCARKLNIDRLVEFSGRIPRSKLLPLFKRADAFLLINSYGPRHGVHIPSKLYDYVQFRKPILCLSEQGALQKAMVSMALGDIADPRDPRDISKAILCLYERYYVMKKSFEINEEQVNRFKSLSTTRELAYQFDSMIR